MPSVAPGKLIISGEHSVVYGQPALAMAVGKYARARATTLGTDTIEISMPSLTGDFRMPLSRLSDLRKKLDHNYSGFLKGDIPIGQVASSPFKLLAYAIALILERREPLIETGLRLDITTDIPISCGMGSSAAVVLASLATVAKSLGLVLPPDSAFRLTWETEKLQHGHPSGVDPWICCYGGAALFKLGSAQRVTFPDPGWSLIHTGKPATTTGEAVAEVARNFGDSAIWREFATTTTDFAEALLHTKAADIHACIRKNHRLLCQIGVVPLKIQKFIAELENRNCSAKISGSGAVSGENAGVLLAYCDKSVNDLCLHYGYRIEPISIEERGLRN